MLTLSLIIPVYNEERYIKACLDAVSIQSIKPLEVIVIDNNCTDNTIKIASSYDFVKIIKEKRQGLIHARNTGFDAAKGDIIGRIDADSIIDTNWTKTVSRMLNVDKDLYGVTGIGKASIILYSTVILSTIISRIYFYYVQVILRTNVLWGANMAIRKSIWDNIKPELSLKDNQVHEDQDISIVMQAKGYKIQKSNELLISTLDQSSRYLPKMLYYRALINRTKRLHKKLGNLNKGQNNRYNIYYVVLLATILIIPILLMYITSFITFPIDFLLKKLNLHPNF